MNAGYWGTGYWNARMWAKAYWHEFVVALARHLWRRHRAEVHDGATRKGHITP